MGLIVLEEKVFFGRGDFSVGVNMGSDSMRSYQTDVVNVFLSLLHIL